jgi:hypothetical protein
MSQHNIEFGQDFLGRWRAGCSCGWMSMGWPSKNVVEGWAKEHQEEQLFREKKETKP